jgi:hypothetical protein
VTTTKLQWGIQRAKKSGWKIVEPKPNQLQLDLDGARAVRRYGMQFSILKKSGLANGWKELVLSSKKSGHVHVVITLPKAVRNLERVALQAILGSDIKREAFNFCRVKKRNKYPIVLFRREE